MAQRSYNGKVYFHPAAVEIYGTVEGSNREVSIYITDTTIQYMLKVFKFFNDNPGCTLGHAAWHVVTTPDKIKCECR